MNKREAHIFYTKKAVGDHAIWNIWRRRISFITVGHSIDEASAQEHNATLFFHPNGLYHLFVYKTFSGARRRLWSPSCGRCKTGVATAYGALMDINCHAHLFPHLVTNISVFPVYFPPHFCKKLKSRVFSYALHLSGSQDRSALESHIDGEVQKCVPQFVALQTFYHNSDFLTSFF